MAMAMFGKKKKKPDDASDDGAEPQPALDNTAYQPDPAKAKRFFDHARAMHDSANYEYAMTLWLQGLRKDPTSLDAVEQFFSSAQNYLANNPKAKGPSKDQLKNFGGKGDLEKMLLNLLHWGTKPQADWPAGMKAMAAAAELELDEVAFWVGERVLNIARNDPKVKKDQLVTLMRLFEKCGGYDKAVQAGEAALAMDKRDGKLEAEVRNMSATATMRSGGYDQTGEAGGFRKNVRDIDKQRELEQQESKVKSEQTLDQMIKAAADDYKARPTDEAAVQKLGTLLRERGRPDDEKLAVKVFLKAHKDTRAYKFKEMAGDIRMRIARRELASLRKRAEETGSDEDRAKLEAARRKVLEFETQEFEDRVANYPTDVKLKYELGRRYFDLGDYEKAIEFFQQATGAAGLKTRVLSYLGQSFAALGWLDGSENAYRDAISSHPSDSDDTALELRYNLMTTLERKAREDEDPDAADEAYKLASSISVKSISFRDIRDKRGELQALVKELRA